MERQNRNQQGAYDDKFNEETGNHMLNYNQPEYYNVKRKEFGHGQSGNMNPGRSESYGERSFRGFGNDPTVGRDYEDNIGYRDNYNRLSGSEPPFLKRSEEGRHRGKGPRSYKRTDERILEDINDKLSDNPYIDASEVEVTVQNGEVILAGTVQDRIAKRLAAEIGEDTIGVKNVENRLRVKTQGV